MAHDSGNVKYEEEFILNSREMELFTCKWLPMDCEPKALIFLCHGYAMECSISMNGTGTRLAKAGFAVYGIDYEGHGKSSGLEGYVHSFDDLVNDCSDFFSEICEKQENKRKMRFVLGESMGGAVALMLSWKKPEYWDGAILVAPMCKLAEDMKPHPVVISVLTQLCKAVPTWKLIPSQDIIDLACRVPEKREEVRDNPYCYKGRPRLKTGHELYKVTLEIEQRLHEVSVPFIVLHGEADKVTDISVSKLLYESASSTDKTLKTYPEMWHALTYGETPENTDIVFADIVEWLETRAAYGNSRLEKEQKRNNEFEEYSTKNITC